MFLNNDGKDIKAIAAGDAAAIAAFLSAIKTKYTDTPLQLLKAGI